MHMPLHTRFTHAAKTADETALIDRLMDQARLTVDDRAEITAQATQLVRDIRGTSRPTMMEHFLAEYGLSTAEGVALMCLAEAMLRVPDAETIDALIEDKIAPSDWGAAPRRGIVADGECVDMGAYADGPRTG